MELSEAIEGRRSIRGFSDQSLPPGALEEFCKAGLRAPAPHHTRPWRFVVLESSERRARLAAEMSAAWRQDLTGDRVAEQKISELLEKSRRQIIDAPGLVLCGIVGDGLRDWPDQRRHNAEWQMAAQSMGAALQNIMLVAHEQGVASFWISAPLFAQEAVRRALDLPENFLAQAFIAFGYLASDYVPRARPAETTPFVSTI